MNPGKGQLLAMKGQLRRDKCKELHNQGKFSEAQDTLEARCHCWSSIQEAETLLQPSPPTSP